MSALNPAQHTTQLNLITSNLPKTRQPSSLQDGPIDKKKQIVVQSETFYKSPPKVYKLSVATLVQLHQPNIICIARIFAADISSYASPSIQHCCRDESETAVKVTREMIKLDLHQHSSHRDRSHVCNSSFG